MRFVWRCLCVAREGVCLARVSCPPLPQCLCRHLHTILLWLFCLAQAVNAMTNLVKSELEEEHTFSAMYQKGATKEAVCVHVACMCVHGKKFIEMCR